MNVSGIDLNLKVRISPDDLQALIANNVFFAFHGIVNGRVLVSVRDEFSLQCANIRLYKAVSTE